MRDHAPISLRDFQGELDRGSDEMVPPDHFIRAKNLIYPGRSVRTRYGFSSTSFSPISGNGILRAHVYKRVGEADRFLLLDSTGKLWDSTNTSAAIYNSAGVWTDFSMVSLYNRAYITPHNRVTGLPGEFVYVYEGSGVLRKIAGLAVATQPTVADSPDAGNVSAGWHQYAVAFETSTGFITKPCTAVPFQSTGSKKVRLTNIPTGPANTVARRILSSQRILDYAAATYNPLDYEMFFVPNGNLADNVTTTLDINFFDTDLQDSADFLLDQLSEVPAGVCIVDLDGRLCIGGIAAESSIARTSKSGDPESFSDVDGFITVSPAVGGGIRNIKNKRGTYYFLKAGRMFSTTDLGSEPANWRVNELSVGIGTECFGIGEVLESPGDSDDFFVFADRKGLMAFSGGLAEFPLTWKVDDVWKRINVAAFNTIQVFIDPRNSLIYVSVPLDSATKPNYVLRADYSEGLAYDTIKWSEWSSDYVSFQCIFMNTNNTTQKSEFRGASNSSNKLFLYDESVESDDGQFKESYIEFPFVGDLNQDMSDNHFTGMRLRIAGLGSLECSVRGQDLVFTDTLETVTLAVSPGTAIFVISDFVGQKASYKIRLAGITSYFYLDYAAVFAKPLWQSR